MNRFAQLFGRLLALVYHCFDRIVILGHLPLLTRPENIVHFFRDVHGIRAITKEVLRKRTDDYHRWVESFARNHQIPIEWAEKGVRKEHYVLPALQRMERQHRFGVYFILKSMELGTTFRSTVPKYPAADPDYRILSRQRCRYTHALLLLHSGRGTGAGRGVRGVLSALFHHLLAERAFVYRAGTSARGRGVPQGR